MSHGGTQRNPIMNNSIQFWNSFHSYRKLLRCVGRYRRKTGQATAMAVQFPPPPPPHRVSSFHTLWASARKLYAYCKWKACGYPDASALTAPRLFDGNASGVPCALTAVICPFHRRSRLIRLLNGHRRSSGADTRIPGARTFIGANCNSNRYRSCTSLTHGDARMSHNA